LCGFTGDRIVLVVSEERCVLLVVVVVVETLDADVGGRVGGQVKVIRIVKVIDYPNRPVVRLYP
jgi:hypothetical protein